MKSTLLAVILAAGAAHVSGTPTTPPTLWDPAFWEWHPPGPDDVRGPCPMLNTLSNHGFFPHSGRNFTQDVTRQALRRALYMNESLADFLFGNALTTNPAPNATEFSLETLRTHDILEHDASLSRADFYFGNNYAFNASAYAETRSHWTASPITVQMAANARYARVQTSNATNPTFGLSVLGEEFGFGESAAYLFFFGDDSRGADGGELLKGEARREMVEYFFEHERLPLELGWRPPCESLNLTGLVHMIDLIEEATPGWTGPTTKKRAIHAGYF